MLVAFSEDDIVPVTKPSMNFTLNPSKVSLNPSKLPFSSEKRVSLLLGYKRLRGKGYSANVAKGDGLFASDGEVLCVEGVDVVVQVCAITKVNVFCVGLNRLRLVLQFLQYSTFRIQPLTSH